MPAILERETLLVCPATDDGIASAMILNLCRQKPRKTYFLRPFSLSDIFAYPAYERVRAQSRLWIAGFNEHGDVGERLHERMPAEWVWWSHHFWDDASRRRVGEMRGRIRNDTTHETTASLIRADLGLKDDLSRRIAESLALGIPSEGPLENWFFASLSARQNPAPAARMLDAFFSDGPEAYPDDDTMAEGRHVFETLQTAHDSSSLWRFDLPGGHQALVMPLPVSLVPYYPVLCALVWDDPRLRMAILLVDREDSIIVRLRHADGTDPMGVARWIDAACGRPVARLFDRLTIVAEVHAAERVNTVELLAKRGGADA